MNENSDKIKTQICRLCLAHTTTFFSLVDHQEFVGMLEALTSLRIMSNDVISTVMCLKCRLNLKLAYTIQQNMLRAAQRFQEKLVKKEDIIEDFEITNHDPLENEECEDDEKKDPIFSLFKTYTCDICGKTKYSQADINKHKRWVHVMLKCSICDKEITQTNFKRHVERHTSPSTICDICGAKIKNKYDLQFHMKNVHSEARRKCRFCDKVFKGLATKNNHENREHIGQPKFVCDVCGKKFYTAAHLKTHTNMKHLKLRPHICDFCKVGFSSSYALRTHRRQHTKETPYRCEVCGEGFRQNVSLKSHRKSKHQIEEECTVECKVCDKKFATKAALYSHQRLH